MLDTVSVGVTIEGLRLGDIASRGWKIRSETDFVTGKGTNMAYCEVGGVRMFFLAGVRWLGCEASLPKMLNDDNAALIGPTDCARAIALIREVACATAGRELPPLTDWKVSRFDACWAWPSEPSAYIAALSVARLPRTEPKRFEGSVSWVTTGNRTKGRCYDKARERGHLVELPLRLERQVMRREPIHLNGVKIGRGVGEVLNERVCLGVIREAVKALGLDKPIPSFHATKDRLMAELGHRGGWIAYGVLRDVLESGGWPSYYSKQSRRDYERKWRRAGVSVVSPMGELPPLEVPTFPDD